MDGQHRKVGEFGDAVLAGVHAARVEADRDLSGTVLLTRHGDTLFEGCYGLANRAAAVPWGLPETSAHAGALDRSGPSEDT